MSESSVKRWVDQGSLKAARTAGGHRRITRAEALRFIREQHGQLVRPDKLGLEARVLGVSRSAPLHFAAEQLYNHLADGHESETRGLVSGLYLAGNAIPTIADEVIRPALERLGALWLDGPDGIMVEHRATELCLRALDELRSMLRVDVPAQRVAVVAGSERDPYLLPPMLAGMTLVEAGWRVVSLGANAPFEVVALAAREAGARLVALSVTEPPDPALRRPCVELVASLTAEDRLVAVGGQSIADFELIPSAHLFIGLNLTELASFARQVR